MDTPFTGRPRRISPACPQCIPDCDARLSEDEQESIIQLVEQLLLDPAAAEQE